MHDADGAYSGRLAPLFGTFDALGFRITVSAFAFWADWARDGASWDTWRSPAAAARGEVPVAVPFCDPDEGAFYQALEGRGHELALHSPSDTSSVREDVIRAFDAFTRRFGHPPKVYVEHSSRSNKDALGHEGADPSSPYYCLDLLRDFAPWIWVDEDGALRDDPDEKFFEIPPGADFTNTSAASRYRLPKAFLRTGRWTAPGGEGFLTSYSMENLRMLENDGGCALAYTHLNDGWLDPATGRMRTEIRERLEYLSTRAGWFAPAGEILDRAEAVDKVRVTDHGESVTASNLGHRAIDRLLLTNAVVGSDLVIGTLAPGASRTVAIATGQAIASSVSGVA